MIGNLLRVTSAELASYLEDSNLLEERVYPEEDIPDLKLLDIDKSWAGIMFLLNGCGLEEIDNAERPLSLVFYNPSAHIIDENQDMGYGPAVYCTSEEVKEISSALDTLSVEDLEKRFDPTRMEQLEIYPFTWTEEGEFNYLADYFKSIKEFYKAAADSNETVISFIN